MKTEIPRSATIICLRPSESAPTKVEDLCLSGMAKSKTIIWKVTDKNIIAYCETDWSVQPFDNTVSDFVLETTIQSHDAISAGVVFGLGNWVFDGGLSVILDYRHNEVLITTARNFQVFDARTFNF